MRLSESFGNTGFNTEYIYLVDTPVAVIKSVSSATSINDKLFYIVSDHLATPKLVLDNSQTIVWTQIATPFGVAEINEDPDGDGQAYTLDARFPGQYFDTETGLSYNYFRDENGDCPQTVTGVGLGKTPQEAWRNAKHNADSNLPQGCQKRHCRSIAGSCAGWK